MTEERNAPGPAISVENVSKTFRLYTDKPTDLKHAITRLSRTRFDEFRALHDVSLEVAHGESFGLIGHNGSGKSTLLRLMARIHQPTTGRVRTRGRVSALLELGAGFHPELSGRENVYLNGAILGLRRREIDAVFDEVVAFAGLERFIDSPVKVYSSGMYVRLGFAVAVHVEPDILMIDEVIAVGDEEFQRRCLDHLYQLRRDGVSIVLVSHSMGTMQGLCDRLAWLDHGELQKIGTPAEVVRAYLGNVDDAEERRLVAGDEVADPTRALRRGTREIEITHFEVLDADKRPVLMPESGGSAVLRVHYEAHEPVDSPKFGIELQAENGFVVSGRTSREDGILTGTITGTGYIDCVIDALPFNVGVLLVSIGITDEREMHVYDHLYQGYELRVRADDGPRDRGIVRLRGTWTSPVPTDARELLG